MHFNFDKHTICETSAEGGSIAVDPCLARNHIGFFCLSHHRLFRVATVIADQPDYLEWEDDRGRRFFLRPLTLEAYRGFRERIRCADYPTLEALYAAIRDALSRVH